MRGAPITDPVTHTPEKGPKPKRSIWIALLLMRCPRCRSGRIFRGTFAMNDPCPECGMVFEREPGYFLGAMYFSYLLAAMVLVPMAFILMEVFPNLSPWQLILFSTLPYLPLIPLVFRYSRVLWLYLDRTAAPTDHSSHEGWAHHRGQKPEDNTK